MSDNWLHCLPGPSTVMRNHDLQIIFSAILILFCAPHIGSAGAPTDLEFLSAYVQKHRTPPSSTDPTILVKDLAESFFEDGLVFDPIFATYIGDHRYDALLRNDISREYIYQFATFNRAYLRELRR